MQETRRSHNSGTRAQTRLRELTGAIATGQVSSRAPSAERQLARFTRLLRQVGIDASADMHYARLARCSAELLGALSAERRQREGALTCADVWSVARAVAQLFVSHHRAEETADGALIEPPPDLADAVLRLTMHLSRRHGAREWCLGLIPVFGAAGATITQLRSWIPHLPGAAVSMALRRLVRTGAVRPFGDRFVLTASGQTERDTRVLSVGRAVT